jgi:hypothetical protein
MPGAARHKADMGQCPADANKFGVTRGPFSHPEWSFSGSGVAKGGPHRSAALACFAP